jgi:hypothetical protein
VAETSGLNFLTFGQSFIVFEPFWTSLKTTASAKGLSIQYDDDGYVYQIFAIDVPTVYQTRIWHGTVPADVIAGGYSQAQNDADETDFETNFKPFANKPLAPKSNITLGYTTSSGSALTVIRATAYTEQTTNAQRSVLSSSASDASAGTGARTIKLTYYDQTLLGPFTETVTMNGTSAVNTVGTNICFIEKIEVMTVGNQLSNVGTITLKAATAGGGATIGTIPAGDGITNWCHHYVGTNRLMSLVTVIGTVKGSASGAIEVHRTIPTDVTRPELTIAPKIRIDSGTSDKLDFTVPILVTGPALVVVYGRSDSSSGNIDWSVGMGYYEA